MTHKVGAKGQVVIPKDIRDEIGIEPGDVVIFEVLGTEVRMRRVADDPGRRDEAIRGLRGKWEDSPGAGTAELLEERRRERELEEHRIEGRGDDRLR
jgi:AbrB family looped-hinge helix DNA binding protein